MKRLLMGNEAFAWAALCAGVNVVAGYPGTPSSEVIETVARLHAQGVARGVHVEWSTNEKAALELLAGASMAGARCLFTCKQVGLNVASDALMSLNYVGIRGGVVLFVADDPGPISSQTEQDTRRFGAFAKVPVLDPATPEQGWEMMQAAFELSEAHGTPVIVRPTTRINHSSTFFDVPEFTQARTLPEEGFQRSDRWIIFPRRAYEAHGEVNERLVEIAGEYASTPFNPVCDYGEAPKLAIVAGGVSAAYAADVLEDSHAAGALLVPVRFVQVGTPYPFPEAFMRAQLEGIHDVLVLEELDYVLEDELWKLAGRTRLPLQVHGKQDQTVPARGELSYNIVSDCISTFLGGRKLDPLAPSAATTPAGTIANTNTSSEAQPRVEIEQSSISQNQLMSASGAHEEKQPVAVSTNSGSAVPEGVAAAAGAAPVEPPVRPPVLCAGCPHRGAFYAVKRAVGKREHVFCGDIGCYTLGNAAPLNAVDTCLCMGAGITMAQGFATARPSAKCVAFVGDSTFFASGMTGVANAVYNQHDVTICVLDNSTTAMTGTQPHPGTGATLMGAQSTPILPEAVLEALGVTCIEFANPLYLEEAQAAAQRAIDFEGPSAIIFRSPCTQIVKPEPAAQVDINTCTGCRRCIAEIGCPALCSAVLPNDGPIGAAVEADGAGKPCVDQGTDHSPLGSAAALQHSSSSTSLTSHQPKKRSKVTILASSCYGCGLCADVCPFGAISVPVRTEGRVPHGGARGAALDKRQQEGGAHA